MNKKLTKLLSVFAIAGAISVGAAFAATGCSNKPNDQDQTETNSVTGVTASASATTFTVGGTVTLTATVTGTGSFTQSVTWAITEGADYATVSGNTLTATAAGTVKVQATSVDDTTKKSAEITITVTAATQPAQPTVTGVTASASATTGKVGDEITLTATVTGTGSYSQEVTWAITAGDKYATIDGNKLTLTAAGTVKVQATSVGDTTKKSDEITITITAATQPEEGVTNISTVDDLLAFRALSSLEGTYKLVNDIDLAGVTLEASKAVLKEGVVFDGNGYTISNAVYEDASSKEGVLLKTIEGGTVTNIKFLNCSISSSNESPAILAGECNGTATISKIEFNSCTVETTSNYGGLIFARSEAKVATTITISEITVKNDSSVQRSQYGGLLVGDLTAATTVNFKDLDIDGALVGSSGNGSLIAGRTRAGATVSVENAVISSTLPAQSSIGIFSGGGKANLTIKNVLIVKAEGSAILWQASNAPDSPTIENVVTVSGVNVTGATASDGVESVEYLKNTLGFDFANVWVEEGESGYRLKAASPNVKSEGATIKSIKLNANNAKVRYKEGEKFAATGISIMGVYSDGVQLVLKEGIDFTVDSSAFASTQGEYEIVVKSVEDNTVTAKYSVSVVKQLGFVVYDEFVPHVYLQGDDFNSANLVVNSVWSDGVEERLSSGSYTIGEVDTGTSGNKTVTITYGSYTAKTFEIAVVSAAPEIKNNTVTINVDASYTGVNGVQVEGVETFNTVADAIAYLEACKLDNSVVKVVNIGAGTYEAKITTSLCNLTLIGQNTETEDKSILTYSAVESTENIVTGAQYGLNCATLHVNGEGFTAKNLTIRNDFDYINESAHESSPQGLALTVNGDRAVIENCHLYGNQDTLYLKNGRAYFHNTLIEGNVDFIFGEATGIAFFEDCEIRAINRYSDADIAAGKNTNNGYVTAMKATADNKPDYGYIFYNCDFTANDKVADGSMSLARPWGAAATVAYINCDFSSAYSTLGYSGQGKSRWADMSGNSPVDADFNEYGSTGAGAITEAVNGGKMLTAEQAALYNKENIFAMVNGKCTWSTPWAATNEKITLTVMNGTDNVYSGMADKGITITATLAEQWFEVEGLKLTGLYTDEACTTAFDYATPLTTDITLYASYEDADPTITEYVKYVYDGTAVEKYGKIEFSGMADNDDWLRFDNDDSYVKFTAVKGTVITMTAYQGSVFTFNGTEGAETDGVVEYTVPEDGVVTIQRKAQTSCYLKSIEVNAPVSNDTTIDLLEYDGGQVQGNKTIWKGIEIDATSGKFNNRGSDIQVNAGTVIKLLVAEGSSVNIVSYNGNDDAANWTIDVTGGVATLTCITNTYIKAIGVTVPVKSVTYTYTYGGTNNPAWVEDTVNGTISSSDATPVKAIKLIPGTYLTLNASGHKATLSLNGFTTGSSKEQPYVKVEFLDASDTVIGTLTGNTPANKYNGAITFATDVVTYDTQFTSIRITSTTDGKSIAITSAEIIVE